jgi:DNA-binding response OmpR family regulator
VNRPTVLLIEDQFSLRRVLEPGLLELGCMVVAVDSVAAAALHARATRFDVVVLDIGNGTGRGLEVLTAVRGRDTDAELMLLSSTPLPELAVSALALRVSEVLVAPYRLDDLRAAAQRLVEQRLLRAERVRSIGARLKLAELAENVDPAAVLVPPEQPAPDAAMVLRISQLRQRLYIAGRSIALSAGEVRILICLARVPGAPVSLDQLARDVLLFAAASYEIRELLKSRVYRLRAKIEQNPRQPRILLSIRGIGYCLNPEYFVTIEP